MPTIKHTVDVSLPVLELIGEVRTDVSKVSEDTVEAFDRFSNTVLLTAQILAASIFSLSMAIVYSASKK